MTDLRRADTAQSPYLAGEMSLVSMTAEDSGNAERGRAVKEFAKSQHTLMFLRAQSSVSKEESAEVPAREAQEIRRLLHASLPERLECQIQLPRR